MSDAFHEIPVHRSLTQPLLMAGLPRGVTMVLWTGTAAVTLGLHQFWALPVALVLHAIFAAATRRDPYFFDVFVRAARAQRRLSP